MNEIKQDNTETAIDDTSYESEDSCRFSFTENHKEYCDFCGEELIDSNWHYKCWVR